jgi:dihydroflavonol-4-reductase
LDLVTGATGFVGPHLAEALIGRGRHVRCIVRDRARAQHLERLGAAVLQVERLDATTLAPAFEGVERVFHLAGGGKVSTASDHGLAALRSANVAPLEAVLRAARGAAVRRVVHFSSISAMGIQLDARLDEDSPCQPRTPHEIAKFESERVALEAWAHGVPVVVLRPSQIYGPGDARSEILTLVRLAKRGLVPMFGGGEGLVPWVFVSDVVEAALAAAEEPAAIGRTYIISDSESYPFADVVRAIAAALGRKRGGVAIPLAIAQPAIAALEVAATMLGRDPLFTQHRLASMCGRRLVDIARAQRELKFVPRVGLDEGIHRTVRWYVEQRMV